MRTGTSAHRQRSAHGGAPASSPATNLARRRNADGDVRAPPTFGARRCAGVLARNETLREAGMRTRTSAHRQRSAHEVRGRPRPQRNLARRRNADGDVRAPPGFGARRCAGVLARNETLRDFGMRTGTSAHRQRSAHGGALGVLARGRGRPRTANGGARASSPATLREAGMRTGTSAHRQRSAHGGARASSPAVNLARCRNADGDVRAPPTFGARGCAGVLARNERCATPECGRERQAVRRRPRTGEG